MDTKRLIIAIALSIVVITAYQYFFIPQQQPDPQRPIAAGKKPDAAPAPAPETVEKNLADIFTKKTPSPDAAPGAEPIETSVVADATRLITVENKLFTAVFTNEGAGLKSFILKKYKDDKGNPLNLISEKVQQFKMGQFPLYPFHFSPFDGDETVMHVNNQRFVCDSISHLAPSPQKPLEILFKYKNAELKISAWKKFIISEDSYIIRLEYGLVKDGAQLPASLVFGPDLENNINEERSPALGLKMFAYDGSEKITQEFSNVKTVRAEGNMNFEKAQGELGAGFIWAAYHRDYFAAVFHTLPGKSSVRYSLVKEHVQAHPAPVSNKDDAVAGKDKSKNDAAPAATVHTYAYLIVSHPQAIFMGPKDNQLFESINSYFPEIDMLIDYGWLAFIAKLLLKGINLCYALIPNYGWAIILFTVILKIILFPLTYTSSVSMAKMQALQPKLKALRKKYKNMKDPDQRRKFSEEQMALFKEEKVNPASGCLPMLLQLPILFAFFYLLRTSIIVRHEPWLLWLTDLSLKDPFYIMPILNGVSMIALNKFTPTANSAEGGVQQKIMMWMMPVFITFIGIGLPSGLMLYWVASNILQMGQQYYINERVLKKKKEDEQSLKIFKRKKGVKTV